MAGRVVARLVIDEGERFAPGARIRLHRTLSTPQEHHAIEDPDGPYEVLTCTPVRIIHKPLLQLMVREVEPT